MQWSRDLAAEMHQRRLVRNEARRTVTFPSSYCPCDCATEWRCKPMTPALSMTHASTPAPVPFPQLSPHVPSYRPISPSPCALGQQVIALLSRLIVLSRLVYFYPDHS